MKGDGAVGDVSNKGYLDDAQAKKVNNISEGGVLTYRKLRTHAVTRILIWPREWTASFPVIGHYHRPHVFAPADKFACCLDLSSPFRTSLRRSWCSSRHRLVARA